MISSKFFKLGSSHVNPLVRTRELWAWAFFDFANSGYTTVVITAVFSAYFVAVVAGDHSWSTLIWTLSLTASYILVIFSAPILGAYADSKSCRKLILFVSTIGCVLCTATLYFVGPGDLALGIVLIVLSSFFFGTGENLIAAFLPEIAKRDSLGRVSGWGWSLGYLGGLVTLGFCLAFVDHAQSLNQTAKEFVPVTMLITAGIFLLAAFPTFLFVKERGKPNPGRNQVSTNLFVQAKRSWETLGKHSDLKRFLFCIVFYQSGVQAVIAIAAIYAHQVMHFDTADTILLVLVVNITASFGAFFFGHLQDKFGHKRALYLTLMCWFLTVILAYVTESRTVFWFVSNLVGFSLGASQSIGRALVGFLSPKNRSAEFFGLWGLAVKLSSVLGPVTYGMLTWLTNGNHRVSILSVGCYFLVGIFILRGVNLARGRKLVSEAGNLSN